MNDKIPQVLLVGRPNVGKSTIFNRLTNTRAIVTDIPGTTRDRLIGRVDWLGKSFELSDLAGFPIKKIETNERMSESITNQIEQALSSADLFLLVIDVLDGLTAKDQSLIVQLRNYKKPIIIVVNKNDNSSKAQMLIEKLPTDLAGPIYISALHNQNMAELLESIYTQIKPVKSITQSSPRAILIIGKPNVGKSTLLNKIIGFDRSVVSEVAGTTRDEVRAKIKIGGKNYEIIDTAGVRRKAKIDRSSIEDLSVRSSLALLDRSDLVLLVVSIEEGLSRQDARLARQALEKRQPVILALNKSDLSDLPKKELAKIAYRYPFIKRLPTFIISSLSGRGVGALMSEVKRALISPNEVGVSQRENDHKSATDDLVFSDGADRA